ncbi:transcription factor SRM1-like [Telopea speciosissima]|uniref:transcription factor SRM1-like n=1 Tax=Telopea speciosissima TaxID=54955 RepID=UPI001CC7EF30|nr:transcription factor SRM1-like [Telopea speciosissima]
MSQDEPWNVSNLPSTSATFSSSSSWSRVDDKLFEQALVLFPEESPDRWHKIASQISGKTPSEVKEHYEALVFDISEIDSGRIELPQYKDDSITSSWVSECRSSQISFGQPKSKHSETERKKGIPWTEEEHRLFLIGLKKYGKGDWRSISRNAVVSRTPTQVASHAQKYYLRLNSMKKEKKRSSIHDITTVDSYSVVPPPPPANAPNWVEPSNAPFQQAMETMATSRQFTDKGGLPGYGRYNFPM